MVGGKQTPFKEIKSFEEFSLILWYQELSQICSLLVRYRGTKKELTFMSGNIFKEIK